MSQDFWEILNDIWNLKLYSSGDTVVELNQLVVALLIVAIGIYVSQRVASFAMQRLARLGRLETNTAFFLQRLLYYFLVVIVVLIALPIAGIPVTIFTVLGGALAIGVGFGTRNLFNNLISGLIIMFEKPIRLGDIIELEGSEGRIEDIGNRCVRVRRTDGVDVLMPNSFFIEEPVINWTLFDKNVRGRVSVGVAYGSPTEQVRDLITQAVDEHKLILRHPEPIVLFEEFGDSALQFTTLFWAHVTRPMDLRKIQSDIRYRIDALFREKGITIAFPQRHIHFDNKPIEVRVRKV